MYHIELRQFPHSFCRFNLSEHELRDVILSPWARGEWVQAGERKWSPQQARLTVIEGPRLAVQELAMGRGWRNAQRRGKDVTARMLAPASSTAAMPTAMADERKALVDALALELLRLLGDRPVPLARAWLVAHERNPQRRPSECLALAEAALDEHR